MRTHKLRDRERERERAPGCQVGREKDEEGGEERRGEEGVRGV